MNRRERFLETMTFGTPDRPSSGDYFAYNSTRERWEREGLPQGVDLDEYFNLDFNPFKWQVPVNSGVLPGHESVVLEETERYTVVKSGSSIVKTLKDTPPPAMPQFLSYPLQSRVDWEDYKRRLDPETPERLAGNFCQLVEEYNRRDYPLGMWVGGTYGYLRDWWGMENISLLLHDEPALIEEMVEWLTYFRTGLLDRVLKTGVQLDWVMFWEDMAYNAGPLISPGMFKKYCIPFYEKVMEKVNAAGITVAMVDSDGDVREIIPLWLDVGVSIMHPMEVAASMDVVEARKRYGKNIGFFGGIDKRAMAGTREQIKAEVVHKLEYCFGEGGFIPACDHGIPPDISFSNYCYFRNLVRQVTERMYGG